MDRGLGILYNTFWCSKGWKEPMVSDEDFQIAKSEGYMFDYPVHISHSETLNQLHTILQKVNPQMVADAFLYSLSSRRLEYRSALGSYWYAVSIPEHKHTEDGYCRICNWYPWHETLSESDHDFHRGCNVFNFERYKWGGVRHTDLSYALFDLEQFIKLPLAKPTKEDVQLLFCLLHLIHNLESTKKAGAYRDIISKAKIIKTNKSEISGILNLLGICGVLSSKDAPCYFDKFVDTYERYPIEHTNDFAYPINRWHAYDGVNQRRFQEVFGFEYIDDPS